MTTPQPRDVQFTEHRGGYRINVNDRVTGTAIQLGLTKDESIDLMRQITNYLGVTDVAWLEAIDPPEVGTGWTDPLERQPGDILLRRGTRLEYRVLEVHQRRGEKGRYSARYYVERLTGNVQSWLDSELFEEH